MATPEPPVTSARSAAAAPIDRRCASVMASTMAMARPARRSRSKARAMAAEPASTSAKGDMADREAGLALQHAAQVESVHRRQRMVAHAALGERHAVDEEMALVDRARLLRISVRGEAMG